MKRGFLNNTVEREREEASFFKTFPNYFLELLVLTHGVVLIRNR